MDWGLLAQRHGCKLRLLSGVATDRSGQAKGGDACADCHGCSQAIGDLGVTSNGMRIIGTQAGLEVAWDCPGCGRETIDEAPIFGLEAAAKEAAIDGLCYSCRRKAALILNQST